MNHCMRSADKRQAAWNYLRDQLQPDVALLQEASPPPELQERAVYHPIDAKRYNWGSAVVLSRDGLTLRERPGIPLAECYLDPTSGDQLPASHPGACAVADVVDVNGAVLMTVVSFYGQWEVLSDGRTMDSFARTHRMLSDLTWLFHGRKRTPVVLAGDFNMSSQWSSPASVRDQVAAVGARLRAFGLVDCIAQTRKSRPRLATCTCGLGDGCTHVQTFRSNNEADSEPIQLDYAYMSAALVPVLRRCEVVHSDEAWALSDHCPIVLDFDCLPR
ncbi:MAG: endonuclease/exonuclease/phosphatase family protein [Vicinamibacterales bacterium]